MAETLGYRVLKQSLAACPKNGSGSRQTFGAQKTLPKLLTNSATKGVPDRLPDDIVGQLIDIHRQPDTEPHACLIIRQTL